MTTAREELKITTREELEHWYREHVLPVLRIEAYYCGWGLGQHGSMRRDLDLIAVPWRSDARTYNYLAHRLMKKAGGHTWPVKYIKTQWEKKPHGRLAISLPLVIHPDIHIPAPTKEQETHGAYLDLSVMLPVK